MLIYVVVEEKGKEMNGASVELNIGVALSYKVAVVHDPILPYFKYFNWFCQKHTDINF